jgi:hypothetical protein
MVVGRGEIWAVGRVFQHLETQMGNGFKGLREVVHKWLDDQPKTFFLEGIGKLVDRWTKCIEKEGDDVEK